MNVLVLNHIPARTCPQCSAKLIAVRQERRHSNGNFNEYAEFECGFKVHFSPILDRIDEIEKCKNSGKYKRDKTEIIESSIKLVKYIYRMRCPEEFINKIIQSIKYNLPESINLDDYKLNKIKK